MSVIQVTINSLVCAGKIRSKATETLGRYNSEVKLKQVKAIACSTVACVLSFKMTTTTFVIANQQDELLDASLYTSVEGIVGNSEVRLVCTKLRRGHLVSSRIWSDD